MSSNQYWSKISIYGSKQDILSYNPFGFWIGLITELQMESTVVLSGYWLKCKATKFAERSLIRQKYCLNFTHCYHTMIISKLLSKTIITKDNTQWTAYTSGLVPDKAKNNKYVNFMLWLNHCLPPIYQEWISESWGKLIL